MKSDSGIAGEHALGRGLADALLDAGEEALGHRAADDPLGELDAAVRVRLELEPHVAEHAVAAGLLLVAAVDLGLAADRLLVRDRGVWVTIAAPNLRLSRSMMTAVWASPIVRRTCSPVARPLEADRRLLLEHPLEGRAHLVEVALGLRLDARATSDGSGKSSGGSVSGFSFDAERVAGLGHGQLGDGADLAGLELADRLLLLAVEQQELADPLVLAARGVPDVGLRVERPGQDAQVGQPADERVGGRLEDADQERAVLVGGDLDRRARLVGRLGRRLVGRGGQVADDRVEQRRGADALGRASRRGPARGRCP